MMGLLASLLCNLGQHDIEIADLPESQRTAVWHYGVPVYCRRCWKTGLKVSPTAILWHELNYADLQEQVEQEKRQKDEYWQRMMEVFEPQYQAVRRGEKFEIEVSRVEISRYWDDPEISHYKGIPVKVKP
jgi:hypothetical protein